MLLLVIHQTYFKGNSPSSSKPSQGTFIQLYDICQMKVMTYVSNFFQLFFL